MDQQSLQVEMESSELPVPPPPATQPEGLLGLDSPHVVATGEPDLAPQLAETPLEADEGKGRGLELAPGNLRPSPFTLGAKRGP